MIFIYEYCDSYKVGTLGYEEEELRASIQSAGPPHDGGGPRLVIYEFYNHTSKNSIGYVDHFANDKRMVVGVGKCLMRKIAETAAAKDQECVYVVGAKRQAWETYRSLTFRPIGSNVLNWFARTDELLKRTAGAEVVVRTMQGESTAMRAPSSLFAIALAALAKKAGDKPGDDPKDPRTYDGKPLRW
jgi:hypothetical protein